MSIKYEIGLRIKESRKKHKLSAIELSNLTGFSKSRISNWETGRRTPGLDDAKILEDVLGVPAAHLLCMDFDGSQINELRLISKDFFFKIPMYYLSEISDKFPEKNDKWLPIPSHLESFISTLTFSIILDDNSMSELFRKDDIILFEKGATPFHGDNVLIKINTSGKILFRKYFIDNSNIDEQKVKFIALNNEWPEIYSTNESQFIVIGVMRNKLRMFF